MYLDMREDRSETFTHGKIVETSRHGYEDIKVRYDPWNRRSTDTTAVSQSGKLGTYIL